MSHVHLHLLKLKFISTYPTFLFFFLSFFLSYITSRLSLGLTYKFEVVQDSNPHHSILLSTQPPSPHQDLFNMTLIKVPYSFITSDCLLTSFAILENANSSVYPHNADFVM